MCRMRKDFKFPQLCCFFLFEVNTKYISSSAMKKSVFSRVRSTSENADIFTALDEIYLVFAEKK